MSIIASENGLVEVNRPSWNRTPNTGGLVQWYGSTFEDYAAIYRSQPAVRTVVDFLARNVAQLSLKVYRRIDRTEREELFDSELARTLRNPNTYTTAYRLVRDLVSDLAIYDDAFWAKVRSADATRRLALLRLPAGMTAPTGDSWHRPDGYTVAGVRGELYLPADAVVHFRGYNPEEPRSGLSPLETLRRILAEEQAAGENRENFWKNAARMDGVIERPLEAPGWSDAARKRFREGWEARYVGGANAGKVVILEEGMSFKPQTFSPREAEFIEARKLTREEVARAFHIPLPMVGILDHATYSNITEQHKQLYQDTLGPWLQMIEQEIELQLLPEFAETTGVYVEFNMAEKLKGSFEEQAQILQSATGRPYMTANEARARLNLPRLDDPAADILVTPLNVLVGGQASPQDATNDTNLGLASAQPEAKAIVVDSKAVAQAVVIRQAWTRKHEEELRRYFERQARTVKSRAGAGEKALLDLARWNRELRQLLYPLGLGVSAEQGKAVAARYRTTYDEAITYNYLEESSRIAAEGINATTLDALKAAGNDPEKIANVFDVALGMRVAQIAMSRATNLGNFGRREGAKQSGVGRKVWVVNNANSRHPEMDGEAVPLFEQFSNGADWPGDPSLSVEEAAGCECTLEFA